MGIQILGQTDGRERDAAEDFATRLSAIIRPLDSLSIVAGAKCFGEKRQDIDLLMLGIMGQGFRIKAQLLPAQLQGYTVYLSNFVFALEVKDHPPEYIRFVGNQVDVLYNGRPSNVTQQIHEQIYSVRSFLQRHAGAEPWVVGGIWLRNVPTASLPGLEHNILGSNFEADDVIRMLVSLRFDSLIWQKNQGKPNLSISSAKTGDSKKVTKALDLFSKPLKPSALDRKRLELVCQKILSSQQYAAKLGQQMLVFRGRGGAGKTVRLLQIARTLHEAGKRILFLTYNKSLVADVRRLLGILGVSDKVDERTIAIRSSDSFFFAVLGAYGLAPPRGDDDEFPEGAYLLRKKELRELLKLTTPKEVRSDRLFVDHPNAFAWDHVLIDEGQDWPVEERDILLSLFGADHIIVADGVDQYVRGIDRCDWLEAAPPPNRQIVTLKKSLRLKANLCRFVRAFAAFAGLDWDMDVNDDVPGGRVVIVRGPYTKSVHEMIIKAHRAAGNLPLDSLFCVTGAAGAPSADLPARLCAWGGQVWDGTTGAGRGNFPTDVDQYRVVKYESCRGLEGWTVICLDLDLFFDRQRRARQVQGRDLFLSEEEAGAHFAIRWCLIPFTRAIDTLVLQTSTKGPLSAQLAELAQEYSDFVEMVDGK